jgi:hypothetical protein
MRSKPPESRMESTNLVAANVNWRISFGTLISAV